MSLALVQVPVADFHQIYRHMTTYMPRYRNMHLREARQHNRKRVLRYLHALYAKPNPEIEGMISGPGVFWHYKLRLAGQAQTQLQVLARRSAPADELRIQSQFLPEILERMQLEQAGTRHYPKRLSGQFYLRRGIPGMHLSHANCQNALSTGALDRRFLSQLQAWNLDLLHP